MLERHHDAEHHASDNEGDEEKDDGGKRTALSPSSFGSAEDTDAFCALFWGVPCDEFGGRVEVDEEEGAKWPEEREDWRRVISIGLESNVNNSTY